MSHYFCSFSSTILFIYQYNFKIYYTQQKLEEEQCSIFFYVSKSHGAGVLAMVVFLGFELDL